VRCTRWNSQCVVVCSEHGLCSWPQSSHPLHQCSTTISSYLLLVNQKHLHARISCSPSPLPIWLAASHSLVLPPAPYPCHHNRHFLIHHRSSLFSIYALDSVPPLLSMATRHPLAAVASLSSLFLHHGSSSACRPGGAALQVHLLDKVQAHCTYGRESAVT
jgi:hypothetical protein